MSEHSDDGAQELIDALMLHLAAGKEAKTFRAPGIEWVPDPQPITVDLSYDSATKYLLGKATWDLNFQFTQYIELLSLAIETPTSPLTVITGNVRLNTLAKSGSTLIFNTAFPTRQPAKITFEACLMVLGPGKSFVQRATLNL